MRLRTISAPLILACSALQSVVAAPANIVPSEELMARISNSFSKIPMNISLNELEMQLDEIKYSNCDNNKLCWIENADGVRHIFSGEEHKLSEKWIKFIESYGLYIESIHALDLGQARKKDDVVRKISLYLNQGKYECLKEANWLGYFPTFHVEQNLCIWKVQGGEVFAKFVDAGSNGVLLDELAFRRSSK